MNGFSKALTEVRFGKRVTRGAWDEGQWIVLQSDGGPNGEPWIMFRDTNGDIGRWEPTVPDLLITDWSTLPPA